MLEEVKVLFVCIHNSARSQMAEAYLNAFDPGKFNAESAGLQPGELNPIVVKVMMEEGMDLSNNETKSVQDFLNAGKSYDYVIAVCDGASAAECPVFSGSGEKIHWAFNDPSSLAGTEEEKLESTRIIRDEIKNKIENWIKSITKDA